MEQVYLSDTELYFALPCNVANDKIMLLDEEVHHITKVMRHCEGDNIHITSGEGIIWFCQIAGIEKKRALCSIKKTFSYKNDFGNITFCLPLMKSNDRLEFAVEKLVELGITKFIIYSSEKGSSRGAKLDRLEKIALAAMKQSLRSFIPQFEYVDSLFPIFGRIGEKLVFDQQAQISVSAFLSSSLEKGKDYYLVIGPESGFSTEEYELFQEAVKLKLTKNRLRTETAAVTAGAILTTILPM